MGSLIVVFENGYPSAASDGHDSDLGHRSDDPRLDQVVKIRSKSRPSRLDLVPLQPAHTRAAMIS
jgi:hypothetical protein